MGRPYGVPGPIIHHKISPRFASIVDRYANFTLSLQELDFWCEVCEFSSPLDVNVTTPLSLSLSVSVSPLLP